MAAKRPWTSRRSTISWGRFPLRLLAAVALLPALSACTTIGAHVPAHLEKTDFGPREALRFCLLVDENVGDERARALIGEVAAEFARYAIDVQVVRSEPWTRPGFGLEPIITDVVQRPLPAPCDRLVAVVGRHAGDALWGLVMPEVLGAVETATHTKGYVVGKVASLNQAISGPGSTTVHESYHFLGCDHGLLMTECYRRVQAIKAMARQNRAEGRDFFPGLDSEGRPIARREEVEAILSGRFAAKQLPAE